MGMGVGLLGLDIESRPRTSLTLKFGASKLMLRSIFLSIFSFFFNSVNYM